MKNLTILSKKCSPFRGSQSSDVGSRCRVVADLLPSFCRVNMLKLVSVLVLILTIGSGNVWADYTVGFATSGSTVIASGGDYVSGASRGGNTYIESDGLRFGKSGGTGSITVTLTSSGTYVGQIKASKITLKDVKRYGSDASVNVRTTVTYTDDATTVDNYTAPNSASNHDISLNSSKTIKSVKIESTTNTKRFYCKGFTVVAAASCAKKVTITKGTPETGGSFNLDKTGAQDCCDALTVTISSIVAPSGKKFSAITQTGVASGVTIDQSAKTVTYAANTTGSSTINVTFEDKGCTDHGASSITGGALSDADHGPLHAYYDYSTSQILYTKSDLDLAAGKKGTIKSIYFEYSGATAMATRTIKIYMANTDLSSLTTSNYVPYASFTQVYSGTFSCGSAGWYEITLDTPFDYNGIGNLVVMVDDNTNTYESSKSFKYHSATGKQIYKRQDDTDIDPASWTPASAIDYRPNTKFCIQEADMVQYTVNWYVNGSIEHSQTGYPGTTLTGIPTPDESDCDGSKVFVGWYTSPYSHATDAPDFVSPTTIPNGGANYYAVFANAESGSSSKTYEATIQRSHVPASYGGAISNVTAHETGGGDGELTISLSGSNVMQGTGGNNTKIQFRKTSDGAGTIYNTTDLGTINSITTNNSDIKYYINSTTNPSSAGSGGYFRVYNNVDGARYSTSIVVNFTKTVGGTTYSNYATSCCTPLGTINGSVLLTPLFLHRNKL